MYVNNVYSTSPFEQMKGSKCNDNSFTTDDNDPEWTKQKQLYAVISCACEIFLILWSLCRSSSNRNIFNTSTKYKGIHKV